MEQKGKRAKYVDYHGTYSAKSKPGTTYDIEVLGESEHGIMTLSTALKIITKTTGKK
jgi:hypothetical protein